MKKIKIKGKKTITELIIEANKGWWTAAQQAPDATKTSGDGIFGEHMMGGLVHDVVNDGTNGSGCTRVTLEIPSMSLVGWKWNRREWRREEGREEVISEPTRRVML